MEDKPACSNANRHYWLTILVNGGIEAARLAELANQQIRGINDPDNISRWYALRVDCEPGKGISEFKQWLSGLDEEVATRAAQIFITTLMGGSHTKADG